MCNIFFFFLSYDEQFHPMPLHLQNHNHQRKIWALSRHYDVFPKAEALFYLIISISAKYGPEGQIQLTSSFCTASEVNLVRRGEHVQLTDDRKYSLRTPIKLNIFLNSFFL